MYCVLAYTLPNLGPLVSLTYFVIVYCLYAVAHEFTWASRIVSLSVRVALLMATLSCSIAFCERDATLAAILPTSAVSLLAAAYLCYHTRRYDVVGSPTPSYPADHLQGKIVIVTGANTGIGKETAKQLACMGATVVLACRNKTRAMHAMDDIRRTAKTHLREDQLRFLELDLGSLESVRKAVKTFEQMQLPSLDILINNAGIMMGQKAVSKDGFELMMQANHLGHFLFTLNLLPLLEKSKGRVLNLTSSTHFLVKESFDFVDMFCDSKRQYTLFGQYAMTKLANVMFTKELAKKYSGIKSFAVHPGIVRTDVTKNLPGWMQLGDRVFAWIVASTQKTCAQGAYCSIHCAASTTPPPSGSYVVNSKPCPPNRAAAIAEDSARLWDVSFDLVHKK